MWGLGVGGGGGFRCLGVSGFWGVGFRAEGLEFSRLRVRVFSGSRGFSSPKGAFVLL